MSQVDSLLDLGELSSPPATTNTTTTTTTIKADGNNSLTAGDGGDPFDPFAVTITTTSVSSPGKQASLDPFDPFAQIPNSTTNGNLDYFVDNNSPPLSPKSASTSLFTELEDSQKQDDLTQDDLLGEYLVSTNTKQQDYLFSDSLTSPNTDNPLYDMSMSNLTDITPPKAYLEDDLLSSPLEGPKSNGDADPFLDLHKTDDNEVTHITESTTEEDGIFQITRTAVTTSNKLAGQEAQFDDLLDDLESSSPPPISTAPPEEEEEEAARESVTSPFSQDGSTGSDDRPKSPMDHLYDNLPDVQMPKRYSKPEEKEVKNAPKVLIMSESEDFTETLESPTASAEQDSSATSEQDLSVYAEQETSVLAEQDSSALAEQDSSALAEQDSSSTAEQDSEFFTSTSEYETEPSQPFGSLLSTWESNTEGGLPSQTPIQSYIKPKETNKGNEKEQVQIDTADIIRAEDKVEDDLENLPSIENLRSRFEFKDQSPPPVEDKKPTKKIRQNWASSTPQAEEMDSQTTRVNGVDNDGDEEIARENRAKEEVGESNDIHFEQLTNIRTRFENIAAEQKDTTHSQRSPRRSDASRESGSDDGETTDGLPPPEQTRGLLARFRQMEIDAEQEVVPDRKPVRKITPPRQDIEVRTGHEHEPTPERDPTVIRHDDPNPEEEQMPPAAITKNLLAKFKSWEKTNEDPPSPALSAMKQKAALNKPKYAAHSRAAVFENAGSERDYEVEVDTSKPLIQATEHGVFENMPNERPELMRETDNPEVELPPAGATKSLLAQWKTMETVVDGPKEMIPTPKKRFPTTMAAPNRNSELSRSRESLSSKEEQHHDQDMAKEGDNVDDKEAIPPAFTRNLVAKFQQLSDSDRENTPPPSKKKQTPGSKKKTSLSSAQDTPTTVNHNTPPRKWSQPQHHNNRQPEPEIEAEPEPELQQQEAVEVKREIVRADDPADHEDELPPPAFTKNLLARFKSMEDLSRPPPTPELDLAVKKSLAIKKKKVPTATLR